jgi:hypothetical protein
LRITPPCSPSPAPKLSSVEFIARLRAVDPAVTIVMSSVLRPRLRTAADN